MAERADRRYRFGVFEVDVASGELLRQGMRVRVHRQPFQLLCLLLERPGEVLTREEICKELWPDGTFVDFEHGVNAAVNRLREALRDKASAPRYVETLPRRGYRFLGPVEVVGAEPVGGEALPATEANASEFGAGGEVGQVELAQEAEGEAAAVETTGRRGGGGWLTSVEDLPKTSSALARTLFVLLQGMYLGFYVGALGNLGEIRQLMGGTAYDEVLYRLLVVSAGMLIPVRLFLLCAALFRPPEMRRRYLRLWPALLAVDLVWALSPFLLMNHINEGVALACVAPLTYAPFAQRSLVLMGAVGAAE